jgi:DNA-3-methyladenine glycosylase
MPKKEIELRLQSKEDLDRIQALPRGFYLQDTFACLRQCLGKLLVTNLEGEVTAGRIVEAEAYIGGIDKASHSYKGKRTPRTEIQFGVGGHAYIFQVHTHQQFCFVTGGENISDVVLVRAIEPVVGIDTMKQRRPVDSVKLLGNGPGKLCKSLGITKDLYGQDLTISENIWLADDGYIALDENIVQTQRVGIDYAEEYKDMSWRYYINDSPFVSKK